MCFFENNALTSEKIEYIKYLYEGLPMVISFEKGTTQHVIDITIIIIIIIY